MFTWRKWWLLFSAIWFVVALLQVVTILAVSEEPERAWQPAFFGLAVPATAYFLGWIWERLRKKS